MRKELSPVMCHYIVSARMNGVFILTDAELDLLAWDISDAIAKSDNPDLDFGMDAIKPHLYGFLTRCRETQAVLDEKEAKESG